MKTTALLPFLNTRQATALRAHGYCIFHNVAMGDSTPVGNTMVVRDHAEAIEVIVLGEQRVDAERKDYIVGLSGAPREYSEEQIRLLRGGY